MVTPRGRVRTTKRIRRWSIVGTPPPPYPETRRHAHQRDSRGEASRVWNRTPVVHDHRVIVVVGMAMMPPKSPKPSSPNPPKTGSSSHYLVLLPRGLQGTVRGIIEEQLTMTFGYQCSVEFLPDFYGQSPYQEPMALDRLSDELRRKQAAKRSVKTSLEDRSSGRLAAERKRDRASPPSTLERGVTSPMTTTTTTTTAAAAAAAAAASPKLSHAHENVPRDDAATATVAVDAPLPPPQSSPLDRRENDSQQESMEHVHNHSRNGVVLGTIYDAQLGTDVSIGFRRRRHAILATDPHHPPLLHDTADHVLDELGNAHHPMVNSARGMTNETVSTHESATVGLSPPSPYERVWTVPGLGAGLVWTRVSTNAPPSIVAQQLRCIGPLLALVTVQLPHPPHNRDSTIQPSNSDHELSASSALFQPSQSLQDAASTMRQHLFPSALASPPTSGGYEQAFDRALELWHRHVLECWSSNIEKMRTSSSRKRALKYRLSCLRVEPFGSVAGQQTPWRYQRADLLREIADDVVPLKYTVEEGQRNQTTEKKVFVTSHLCSNECPWTVDLKYFDLEVVILVRPGAVAVGLSLRPYNQRFVGPDNIVTQEPSLSFATGTLPPDITPPYLAGTSIPGLVRLRPSTAQALWRLAGPFRPGDVVLDPCAGIGTIPYEGLMISRWQSANSAASSSSVITFGLDLVLTPSGLGPIAADYGRKIRNVQWNYQREHGTDPSSSSVSNLCGGDAMHMPFRSASIDVIISDLPFGKLCLSSSKLDKFLPLIMTECARVLRVTMGRMVLLCGSYVPVLKALEQVNYWNNSENISREKVTSVWDLRSKEVFPVNIGGLLAWVVLIQRGDAAICSQFKLLHLRHVQRLTLKRSQSSRHHYSGTEIEKLKRFQC